MTIQTVIAAAFTAPVTAERSIGCGRVYVCVPEKAEAAKVKKAAKAMGRLFQTNGHTGMKNALYVGYDNCDGVALARGTAIVEALKAAGITAYREEMGD